MQFASFTAFKPKYADPKPPKEREAEVMFDPREVYPGYQSGYRDRGRYDSDRGGLSMILSSLFLQLNFGLIS